LERGLIGIIQRASRKTRFKAGLALSSLILILAVVALYIVPFPQDALGYVPRNVEARRLLPPSGDFLFGTDHLGRDLFSRVIMGARTALIQVLTVTIISLLLGIIVGVTAAYFRGLIETLLNYFVEVFMPLPAVVIALVLRLALGSGIHVVILALVSTWWAWYARITYVYARGIVELDYVVLAKLVGLSNIKVISRHVVLNIIQPLVVQAITDMGGVLLEAASINFLGLGLEPGSPEWGVMLYEALFYAGGVEAVVKAPWLVVFPGLFLLLTILGFSLLGDCLREEIDPRLRRRWRLWF